MALGTAFSLAKGLYTGLKRHDERQRQYIALNDELDHSDEYLLSQRQKFMDEAISLRQKGLETRSQKRAYNNAVRMCINYEIKICRLTETFNFQDKLPVVRDEIVSEIRQAVGVIDPSISKPQVPSSEIISKEQISRRNTVRNDSGTPSVRLVEGARPHSFLDEQSFVLPRACQHCDHKLSRGSHSCGACGASFKVHETAVKSMYLMAGVMGFGLIVIGNGFYQTLKTGAPLDIVMQIVFPALMLLLGALCLWFLKQARNPRKWAKWESGWKVPTAESELVNSRVGKKS